jgi:ribosomal protein S18 acetylase RimI-like enzyme
MRPFLVDSRQESGPPGGRVDDAPREWSGAITLRPAGPDDEPFLLRVYASTREEELAITGWDEGQKAAFIQMQFVAQSRHYRGCFAGCWYDVIQCGEIPIGRIFVVRGEREIRVVDVGLLPEYRNRGIGGRLMRSVLDEGLNTGKPVRLHVETFNHGALRFYERLGFRPINDYGMHIEMEWLAKPLEE